MPRNRTSPKIARPTRTALQGGAGYLVAQFIDEAIYDMTAVAVGILALILTVFFSWAQATVEDYIGKALLREIPERDQPGADDARPEHGQSVLYVVLVVVAVLLAILLLARIL